MAHLDWSSTADSDPKQSAVTRRELFSRFADTPTLVIGGHFSAGHIKRDGDAFKFVGAGAIPRVGGACAVSNHEAPRAHHRCERPRGGHGARAPLPTLPCAFGS